MVEVAREEALKEDSVVMTEGVAREVVAEVSMAMEVKRDLVGGFLDVLSEHVEGY